VDNNFWTIEDQGTTPFPSKNYFLNVSRQVSKKNLIMLLEAFNIYSKNVTLPKDLILVGDGPERPLLEQYVRDNKLENVHFLPFVQQRELRAVYRNSLCFILASKFGETWGLTVNEAMASGKPVLVSGQAGCSSTLVKYGINGFTFSPEDVGELSGLLLKMHDLPENDLKIMGDKSKEIIMDWGLDRFCTGVNDAIKYVESRDNEKYCVLGRVLLFFWKGRYRPT